MAPTTVHSFYAAGMLAVVSLAALVLLPDASAAVALHAVRVDRNEGPAVELDAGRMSWCPGFEAGLQRAARAGEAWLGPSDARCAVRTMLGDEWDSAQVATWSGTAYRFDIAVG